MTDPAPPASKTAMVRVLYVAIAVMTTAIVVILIAMMLKLASPSASAPRVDAVDFAAAPEVEIGLPPGARVVETHVSAERLTLVIETAAGETQVFTAPLGGHEKPVRLVFRTLE